MADKRLAHEKSQGEERQKDRGRILLIPPSRKLRMSRRKVEH